MKIYEEYLNTVYKMSVPENIYENEETFEHYLNYIDNISKVIFYEHERLKTNFKNAILQYARPNRDYIIHKFKDYYAISLVLDDFVPREISNEILVFDKEKIYPIQEIEISLDFKYNY